MPRDPHYTDRDQMVIWAVRAFGSAIGLLILLAVLSALSIIK